MTGTAEHVQALRKHGYVVLPEAYDARYVERCKTEISRIVGALAPVTYHVGSRVQLDRFDASISSVGLTIGKILKHAPALVPEFLSNEVLAILRATLGEGFWLETTGATIADKTRAIHTWHQHIGGLHEDLPDAERPGEVVPTSIRRLSFLCYLDELSPEGGPLLVHPRRLADPLDCPFPGREREPWPEQVAITCPAGTAVLIEERTWHGSLPPTTDGLRRFVGAWFASRATPRGTRIDDSVAGLESSVLHEAVRNTSMTTCHPVRAPLTPRAARRTSGAAPGSHPRTRS